MKKTKLILLPILAMSAMALSSCTKDDISSLGLLGSDLQSQIDEIKGEISDLRNQISALREELNITKKEIKDDYGAKIDLINQEIEALNNQLNALVEQLANDKQALEDDYNQKITNLKEYTDGKVAELRTSIETNKQSIKDLSDKHDADKSELQTDYNTKLSNLSESEQAAREALTQDYNNKIAALDEEYEEAVAGINEQIAADEAAMTAFKAQYLSEKEALELDYNNKISALQTTFNTAKANIESSIATLDGKIAALQSEMNQKIAAAEADYTGKINSLTSRVAALEEATYHTVIFDTLGGSAVATQNIIHGEKVSKPEDPTKPGFTFKGWTYLGEPWVFQGYVVTENMTITANWEYIDYTVTFKNDDGTVLETQTPVHYGESVIYRGDIPVKPNPVDHYIYTFDGWDVDLTNITGNTVAVAQYTAEYAPYTANFVDENDNILYSVFVKEGETATYVGETPTKADDNDYQLQFQFSGWDEISNVDDVITYKTHFESCTRGLVFEGNSVYQYIGSAVSVVVPAYWNGQQISKISERAFETTNVKQVTISDGITEIGVNAFSSCSSLVSVTMPNSLTTICERAFSSCSALTLVTIPNSVTTIGNSAFLNCYSLEAISIPNSVISLGDSVFDTCISLSTAALPDNLSDIPSGLFYNCRSLVSVVIPEGVVSIGSSAFGFCSSLESIFIPDSVETMWYGVFHCCDNLIIYTQKEYKPKTWQTDWNGTSLVVWGYESNITTNGYTYVLSTQGGVKKAYLVDYDRSIENFEALEVVNGYPLTAIRTNMFVENRTLKTVVLPTCVDTISNSMFNSCASLESITFSNNLVSIGDSAFYHCSHLNDIIIPKSVTYIGISAFCGCTNIHATFESVVPPEMGNDCFFDCVFGVINVPCLGYSEYSSLTAPNWYYSTVKPVHSYVENTIEPTCLSNGSKTLICSDCGHVEATTIPMLDHEWGEWEVVTPADCGNDGLMKRACSVCGTEETSIISSTSAHNYQLVDSEAGTAVYQCSYCGSVTLSFDTSDLTDESKNRLVFDGDGGARFWGRPIGNALPLYEDGTSINCENGECVYDKTETGDYFELVFDLTEEQANLLQNCMLYCDAKPASYLNGTDFWAYGRSNDEWTPGYYIDDNPTHLQFESDGVTPVMADVLDENGTPTGEQVQMGKRVSDYRYVLYVDGEVKDFDDSITNPTHGNNSNMIREEFIVPYTFRLHSGTNRISLHMAGGYRSIFYNFTFRSIA